MGFDGQKSASLLLIQPEYRLKSRRIAIMGETPMVHFGPPNLPRAQENRISGARPVLFHFAELRCMPVVTVHVRSISYQAVIASLDFAGSIPR